LASYALKVNRKLTVATFGNTLNSMIARRAGKRKPKRKMGRPSLGAAARKQIVTLKLTKAEHAAVRAAVRRRGPPTTVSSWFRDHGLAPLSVVDRATKRPRRKRP